MREVLQIKRLLDFAPNAHNTKTWISALANIKSLNKTELAHVVEDSMRNFRLLATSTHKPMLKTVDAMGLIISSCAAKVHSLHALLRSRRSRCCPQRRTIETASWLAWWCPLHWRPNTAPQQLRCLVSWSHCLVAPACRCRCSALRHGGKPGKVVHVLLTALQTAARITGRACQCRCPPLQHCAASPCCGCAD